MEIERRGVPAAVVCTEPFVVTGRAMARTRGNAEYPFAVVAHPIGSASDEEMRGRVAAALPQIVALLTAGTTG